MPRQAADLSSKSSKNSSESALELHDAGQKISISIVAMHQLALPLFALFAAAAGIVKAACIGPLVNQAAVDLIKSFEGWEPDICTS